jgi:ribonuclease HI
MRSGILRAMAQAGEGHAVAYTDGSCLGNPGPGGWGVHVEWADGRVLELGGGELRTTNNRMELRAAIEAVRATAGSPAVRVITDSTYVRSGITRWLAGWKRNGWRTAADQAVENRDLWTEFDSLSDGRVSWEWTRGHAGTAGNERCDAIARWFAEGIGRLEAASGADRYTLAAPRAASAGPPGTAYLSLVDGVVARHPTWAECERRVHGVRGARFRKVRGAEEERAVVEGWGLSAEALEYA